MYYLDSHCHINDEAFKDDLDVILKRMKENEVLEAMIVSSYLNDYEFAKKINYEGLKFKRSLGIYPGDVNDVDEDLYQKYIDKMLEEECDAVGEIGLDYHWDKDNKERQKEIFIRQIEFAKSIDKPIIVHSRDASKDTYDILKKYQTRGVLHCYSGSAMMAKELVKLDYYISFSGTITFKNALEPLKAVKEVPLNRLLVETDSPYLSPLRGKRNDPNNVILVLDKISEILDINKDVLKAQIIENYHELFKERG